MDCLAHNRGHVAIKIVSLSVSSFLGIHYYCAFLGIQHCSGRRYSANYHFPNPFRLEHNIVFLSKSYDTFIPCFNIAYSV